jgi:hypothetical protein
MALFSSRISRWPGSRGFLPLLVGLVGLTLFSLTRTDAIQAADSGELVTAACTLGVAHPPGYPVYVLLGHLFCALPWSTPAGRLAAMSVVSGVWTLLLVYATVVLLSKNRWAASVAALTLATGSLFWRYSSLAEVFTLNAALCATLIYLTLRFSEEKRAPHRWLWAGASGLCAGLAFGTHHSAVFVFPLLATALLEERPWRGIAAAKPLLAALGGAAIGLLPYLQLVLSDPLTLPRWGDPSTLKGFLHHVLRRDYGTFALALDAKPATWENLRHFAGKMWSQQPELFWPISLLALVGLALQGLGPRRGGRRLAPCPSLSRAMAICLGLLPLLAGPFFIGRFNIRPEGVGAQVVERFYILPLMLLALGLGWGLALLDSLLLSGRQRDPAAKEPLLAPAAPALEAPPSPPRHIGRPRLWQTLAFIIVALAGLRSIEGADVSQNYVFEDYGHNLLTAAEPNALVLGLGDVELFSTLYQRQLLNYRRDVLYVDLKMLLYPWYLKQLQHERPSFPYRFQEKRVNSYGLIAQALRQGTPVYWATLHHPQVFKIFPGYPLGPLYRLLPPRTAAPLPRDVAQFNLRLLPRLKRRGTAPEPAKDPWAASLLETYATTWRSLADGLYHSGEPQAALLALTRAQMWAPWSPLPSWYHQPLRQGPRTMP